MSSRKPFQDLSKSQKNRRIKKAYESLTHKSPSSSPFENIVDNTSNDHASNTHLKYVDQVDPLSNNNPINNMEFNESESDDQVMVKVEKKEDVLVAGTDFPASDENQGHSENHHHAQCCAACRQNMELILRKLNEITSLMMDNAKLQNENQVASKNLLPQFPIQDICQLTAFNEILKKDHEARLQYKNMIQLRGGKDVKQHVREILVIVLTNELAKRLSWSGQKNTISVKNMQFVEILVESLVSVGQVTIYDVKSTIQNWLQHATDRIKYAEKKHKT